MVYHPRHLNAYSCHILCWNYTCVCIRFDTTYTCRRRPYRRQRSSCFHTILYQNYVDQEQKNPPRRDLAIQQDAKMLQFFLELLQVAGGDLNISKCACFTVFHRWICGRASLLKIQDPHPLMTITHPHTGEIKNID
jgi:hypothetical protein